MTKNDRPSEVSDAPPSAETLATDPVSNDAFDEESVDEPVQDALVDESDRLMSAVDEIKRLESEKRRLPMSTPEFHRAATKIERMARQVFGIARAQREVGEALQTQHDESIEDEAANREVAGARSKTSAPDPR